LVERTWDPRRTDQWELDRPVALAIGSGDGDLKIIEIGDMGMGDVAVTMPLGMFATSRTGGA
jgi:hypothetical protein